MDGDGNPTMERAPRVVEEELSSSSGGNTMEGYGGNEVGGCMVARNDGAKRKTRDGIEEGRSRKAARKGGSSGNCKRRKEEEVYKHCSFPLKQCWKKKTWKILSSTGV